MKRGMISLVLMLSIGLATTGLAGCDSSSVTPILGDAAFNIINLVLDSQTNKFAVAGDSVLLVKDAIALVSTINANQSPPNNTAPGITQVAILYDKAGVLAQDVYHLKTGKAGIGIILEGGRTFESISSTNVSIDATQTNKITIVPLQNATTKTTVSATKGWQNTGIFLERGKQFTVKYLSGLWTTNKGSIGLSDAAGQPVHYPGGIVCNCGEPIPGYSTQALVGKIGNSQGYIPLQVGDSFAGVSYDNDFLYLRINEADSFLYNNSGSVVVAVTTNNLS